MRPPVWGKRGPGLRTTTASATAALRPPSICFSPLSPRKTLMRSYAQKRQPSSLQGQWPASPPPVQDLWGTDGSRCGSSRGSNPRTTDGRSARRHTPAKRWRGRAGGHGKSCSETALLGHSQWRGKATGPSPQLLVSILSTPRTLPAARLQGPRLGPLRVRSATARRGHRAGGTEGSSLQTACHS